MYLQFEIDEKYEIIAYDTDKFFMRTVVVQLQFSLENDEVISVTINRKGKTNYDKIL